jgi:hypothetical protein
MESRAGASNAASEERRRAPFSSLRRAFILGRRLRGRETATEPNQNYARSQVELADMPSMPGGRTECPETSFIMRLS